jgi:hypothetical protein
MMTFWVDSPRTSRSGMQSCGQGRERSPARLSPPGVKGARAVSPSKGLSIQVGWGACQDLTVLPFLLPLRFRADTCPVPGGRRAACVGSRPEWPAHRATTINLQFEGVTIEATAATSASSASWRVQRNRASRLTMLTGGVASIYRRFLLLKQSFFHNGDK